MFDKHDLIKKKCPEKVTKELDKEIIKRILLHINFLRTKSQKDKLKYNKRRNFVRNFSEQIKNCTLETKISRNLLIIRVFEKQFFHSFQQCAQS